MLTSWEYSPQTEAKRLLHCAHQIAVGFYKANGFAVLPRSAKDSIVSFPDLPYLSISRFWDQASKIDVDTLPLDIPDSQLKDTIALMKKSNLQKPEYQQVQKTWEKYQDPIISEIYRLIPSKKNAIEKLVIMPTSFGTSCSFSVPKQFPTPIYIWLRADQGVESITEAILTALTRNDVYENLGGVWQESEIIVDWLLAYSPLSEILEKTNPGFLNTLTIKNTRSKQNGTLAERSEAFLNKIGAPSTSNLFSLQGNDPQVRNSPIYNLSPREKDLMKLLISKRPSLVTIDEVGDLLFATNEDAFSLEAIAKSIQRLRDKLEANGVSGSFIQTKRGEGYILIN